MSKNKRQSKTAKIGSTTKPRTQGKNTKIVLALALSLAILIVAIILFKDKNKATVIPKNFPTLAVREQAMIKICTAMDEIVAKSGEKQAKIVKDWFEANYLIAIPYKDTGKSIKYKLFRNGKQIINVRKAPKNWLMMILVMPQDIQPRLGKNLDEVAVYDPLSKSIYIQIDKFHNRSPTGEAFILFHETFHAWDHYRSGYPLNKNWQDMMENERQAYIFESQLLVSYLGMPANNLSEQMAKQIDFEVTLENNQYSMRVHDNCDTLTFEPILRSFIWPNATQAEINRSLGQLKLYAQLKKIKMQYPQIAAIDMESLQLGIIAEFHQKRELLQRELLPPPLK